MCGHVSVRAVGRASVAREAVEARGMDGSRLGVIGRSTRLQLTRINACAHAQACRRRQRRVTAGHGRLEYRLLLNVQPPSYLSPVTSTSPAELSSQVWSLVTSVPAAGKRRTGGRASWTSCWRHRSASTCTKVRACKHTEAVARAHTHVHTYILVH